MAELERLLQLTESQFAWLLLLFLRVMGLFVLSPVLGRRNVPAPVKIGLSLLISYLFLMASPPGAGIDAAAADLLPYAMLCVKELLVGLVLGYMTTLFFDVALMAGQLMDVQIGFGMAQIYDPDMQAQVSLLGSFLNYGLLLYFFLVNGHHTLIRILQFTFEKIPVGQVVIGAAIADVCVKAFGLAISMAVSVALPIIAAELILEVILGIMIRSVPQLNIFVVGLSVKILVGLLVLALFIPFFAGFGDKIFEGLYTYLQAAFERMIPAS